MFRASEDLDIEPFGTVCLGEPKQYCRPKKQNNELKTLKSYIQLKEIASLVTVLHAPLKIKMTD